MEVDYLRIYKNGNGRWIIRKEETLLNWAELDLRESIDYGQTNWLRKKADKTSLFEKYILFTSSDDQCKKTNPIPKPKSEFWRRLFKWICAAPHPLCPPPRFILPLVKQPARNTVFLPLQRMERNICLCWWEKLRIMVRTSVDKAFFSLIWAMAEAL